MMYRATAALLVAPGLLGAAAAAQADRHGAEERVDD